MKIDNNVLSDLNTLFYFAENIACADCPNSIQRRCKESHEQGKGDLCTAAVRRIKKKLLEPEEV